MKKKLGSLLLLFLAVLPTVFTVVFFGYLPPAFDIVFYTDNIVGEGSVISYLSSTDQSFAYLYGAETYFGPELRTLRLRQLRYDVDAVTLYIYGVEEVDFLSFDVSLFGVTISHYNADGVTHPLTRTVSEAVASDEAVLQHMTTEDTDEGIVFTVDGISFFPAWMWAVYAVVTCAVSLLLALGLSVVARRYPGVVGPLLSASTVMAALLMGMAICGSLPYVSYAHLLVNWMLVFAAALILGAVTLPPVGTAAVSVFMLAWYIANDFVIAFRGKTIMPADLGAIGTAAEVINGYDLTPTPLMVSGAAVVLLYCVLGFVVYGRGREARRASPRKKRLIGRAVTAAVGAALIVAGVSTPAFRNINTFQWDNRVLGAFHREGMLLTYIGNVKSYAVKRPDGYSREAVDSYLAAYRAEAEEEPDADAIQPTNIIMVMDEAFSDLRTVGVDGSIDVMPFIDSLDENTLEGLLYASVYGGGTCNTEFEALTGNTLAFLGTGAYPYTSNVTGPLFSLASYFSGLDYVTESFHANKATNWNRDRVYPYLGFDAFHAIGDYPTLTEDSYIHLHPADFVDFRYIESRKVEIGGQPSFLFCVTMQNHSDYLTFENLDEAETVAENGAELPQPVRVYLSLVKESDDAVKQLVETYRDADEPTMIIFFGDHRPGMTGESVEAIYTDVQYYLDLYKTKLFIWTNYESETVHGEAISANFLPWLILERGNFPMPPYIRMLGDVHEKYPIISAVGVMDADGYVYDGVSDVLDDPLIKMYQYIQYANLFDEIDAAWFAVG